MYFPLQTREASPARHPGLTGYTPMLTRNTQGVRGLGAMPNVSFTLGPGGQFSIGAASVPTSESLWDEVKTWAAQSSIIAGVPNSLIGIGAGLFVLSWILPGGRRR